MDVFFMSPLVLFFCFPGASFRVDCQVIHIDREPSLGYLFTKYGVHHHLKGCWGVSEPEEHDCWFEQSLRCKEGRLRFIPWFDTYIVVSPSDVKFHKECASTQAVDSLRNEG